MIASKPPIVVGSSFTGLLVSLALSRADIDHVLIGGEEPPLAPRLGESLNECAGPDLWRYLGPEFRDVFVKKNHISLFDGEFATGIHIGNPREDLDYVSRCVLKDGKIRLPFGRTLLSHVDRVRLDPLLYRKATGHPRCRFLTSLVDEVGFDEDDDRVTRIVLQDGTTIEEPKYVFDATGWRGVIAKAADVGMRWISSPQRVVWGHEQRATEPPGARPWWEQGTNLIRLREETDGLRGISWVIPIQGTLSIGLSTDQDDPVASTYDADRLYDTLVAACHKRGIDLRGRFPERGEPIELKHRYYLRDRAYGANWLLAGGTFAAVWFPSSSGIWTASQAANIAPLLLQDPGKPAYRYERTMRSLLGFHAHLEQMIHGKGFQRERDAHWFWSRWLSFIPKRLSEHWRVTNMDYRERRMLHSFFRRGTGLFQRMPRFQMAVWTNIPIRARRVPNLAQQADAWSAYDRTLRFRFENYVRGLGVMLWPPLQKQPEPLEIEQLIEQVQ